MFARIRRRIFTSHRTVVVFVKGCTSAEALVAKRSAETARIATKIEQRAP
jgi:hypothetical protein